MMLAFVFTVLFSKASALLQHGGRQNIASEHPDACQEKEILKFRSWVKKPKVNRAKEHYVLEFENVFPERFRDGKKISLEVVDVGGYQAVNESGMMHDDGLRGEFGNLNIKCGTEANIHFRFINEGTGKLWTPTFPFFFSIFDLDQYGDGTGKESVQVPQALDYYRTKPTDVEHNPDGSFSSTKAGTVSDNPHSVNHHPRHPLATSHSQQKKMVTFLMPPLHTFFVTFNVSAGRGGRSIMFAGASNLVCRERALCSSMTCPGVTALNQNATLAVCKGETCNEGDTRACCH